MSAIVKKKVSEIIDRDYRGFAMYTIESRALPSYIDGLKPSARKLVYAMITQFKGKKVKVAELGSSLPSYNYHHAEGSAMSAVVTLAADWGNNIPIFRGYGNFGSRLIQEAAAPRYIFCDLNPEFKKYFIHNEVCNPNIDVDNPEPQQYLPLIPWILVNGIEGIAVGFACKYLPHDPKDILKATIKAANGKLKSDYKLSIKIPHFKGTIEQDPTNHKRVITKGLVNRVGRNKWEITELPYGYDREKYFKVLSTFIEKKKIADFEDRCDESGFNFLIKTDSVQDAKCAKDPIDYFSLEKSITENYNALDEQGKLMMFENKVDIINKFVEFRIGKVREYIDYEIKRIEKDLNWCNAKLDFITDVISNKIAIMKISKGELVELVKNQYDVVDEVANRLVSIPVYNMTQDQIEELKSTIDGLNAKLSELQSTNERELYIELLKGI